MTLEKWRDLPMGGLVSNPGSTVSVETGSWAVLRPVIDMDRCVHCMVCWIFCPDDSILVEDGKVVGVDRFHCKGCGICAVECPRKCIDMAADLPEGE